MYLVTLASMDDELSSGADTHTPTHTAVGNDNTQRPKLASG